jgi:2-polyprenyl-3-methyl-5-hydroxy-6-metoxy-1,4-benzoquinol methylase
MDDATRSCWCGSDSLQKFAPDYSLCTVCHTLVSQVGLKHEETLVQDDEVDFYGKRYWLEHQPQDFGYPDFYERVRRDLSERCVHWLKALLHYRQPPATVLEIGAGHGAYTALLRWAGFEATALDLSPWVAEFARKRFDIPYLVGPIEEQSLEHGSFDVIVANDLVEHLPEPEATLRECVALLKPGGMFVIQTPEFPFGRAYAEFVAAGDLFLEHMRKSSEHLYLFSRESLEQLLETVGVGMVSFENPVYPYDMLCVASPTQLTRAVDDPSERATVGATAPLVLALIDAYDSWQATEKALRVSEGDRSARLEAIERLDAALKESEADRQARLEVIERLDVALHAALGAHETGGETGVG